MFYKIDFNTEEDSVDEILDNVINALSIVPDITYISRDATTCTFKIKDFNHLFRFYYKGMMYGISYYEVLNLNGEVLFNEELHNGGGGFKTFYILATPTMFKIWVHGYYLGNLTTRFIATFFYSNKGNKFIKRDASNLIVNDNSDTLDISINKVFFTKEVNTGAIILVPARLYKANENRLLEDYPINIFSCSLSAGSGLYKFLDGEYGYYSGNILHK